jgi:proline dehydrogenase
MLLNKAIAGILPLLPKKFIWIFSKRYIAGEKLNDAVIATKKFNSNGIKASIDLLGEFQTNPEKFEYYKNEYLRIIEESDRNNLDTTFSLKPTMFGLLTDVQECYLKIREIVKKAADKNYFVRIDMEDSGCTDPEIDLFKKLHALFPENTGLVFQSYLKRTINDLKTLHEFNTNNTPLNIRLCKGIYIESGEIAYLKHDEINHHFMADLEYMFQNNFYSAIATHDKDLIRGSLDLIKKYKIPKSGYEFQMLYGVTPELRTSLADEGHPMRVYIPYGKDWFNYSTRRLKENPRVMSHLIKALFIRQ